MSPSPTERRRVTLLKKDTNTWWAIPLKRSKWYNLFDAADRVEAMTAAWTIFARMMGDDGSAREATAGRKDREGSDDADADESGRFRTGMRSGGKNVGV